MPAKADKSASFTSVAKGKPKMGRNLSRKAMKLELPLELFHCLLDIYYSNPHNDFDEFLTDLLKEAVKNHEKENLK